MKITTDDIWEIVDTGAGLFAVATPIVMAINVLFGPPRHTWWPYVIAAAAIYGTLALLYCLLKPSRGEG